MSHSLRRHVRRRPRGCAALATARGVGARCATPRAPAALHLGAAVAMSPLRNEPIYTETLRREFNMLVAENAFKMDAMRPSQTTFNFTDADALMAYAEAERDDGARPHARVAQPASRLADVRQLHPRPDDRDHAQPHPDGHGPLPGPDRGTGTW